MNYEDNEFNKENEFEEDHLDESIGLDDDPDEHSDHNFDEEENHNKY